MMYFQNWKNRIEAANLHDLPRRGISPDLELSIGTHFFQILIEACIYPLTIALDDWQGDFNRDFFYKTPNPLLEQHFIFQVCKSQNHHSQMSGWSLGCMRQSHHQRFDFPNRLC